MADESRARPDSSRDANDPDPQRQSLRARLLATRGALPDRAVRETALANRLARWLATMPLSRLAFYWAIKGEPDVSTVVAKWLAGDASRGAALPVVAGDLLEFAPWRPGASMQAGAFGIPVPVTDLRLQPQLLIIPCVGFDGARHRLGYGGGFYDRTLARMKVKPVTVGVAFDCGRVPSIEPRPHDLRLDLMITETGVL